MGSGETVLVTAAAGGTGQFVVQLAKAAGNTVVATCGSDDKAALLKRLGADRVVNYRRESLRDVLRKEYPKVAILMLILPPQNPGGCLLGPA
jgi:NADPH:quinone reductase-like Zn-dependent oxidoreductase